MNIFGQIGLNCFSLVICTVMYITNLKLTEKHMLQNRLFRWLILATMALLALEIGTLLVDGQSGELFYILNKTTNTIFFIFGPIPASIWALYTSYQLLHDLHRLRTEIILLLFPISINTIMSLLSPFMGLFFRVDSSNIYQRGPYFMVMVFASFLPLFYSTILYIVFRKRIPRKFFIPMLLFIIPPVIGALMQTLFYGIAILWTSVTISIFIVHNYVQNERLNLDHLTGVFNRRQIDNYLNDRIQSAKKGKSFSCIILDVDNFKSINDKHGHLTGDKALVDIAQILKTCMRDEDFLARYGGDEFIIVLDISDEKIIKQTIGRIRGKVVQYNQKSSNPFVLSFSAGYKVYDSRSGLSREEFITKADSLMYRDKELKTMVKKHLPI